MSEKEKPPKRGLRLVHSSEPDPAKAEREKLLSGKRRRESRATVEEQTFLKGLAAKLVLKGFREGEWSSYDPDFALIEPGERDVEIPKLVLTRNADDYLSVGLKLEIKKIFVQRKGKKPRDPTPGKYFVSFYVSPYHEKFKKLSLNGMFELKEIEEKILDHFSKFEKRFRK